VNGTVANSNPIVLDSSGRLPNEVWLTYGYNYKFVVKTSAATTLGTYDNLYGIIGVANTSTGTTIPTGMISLWYGSIGSVPTGWYLCDGTNGTPDLRDRFIVGAGSTYSVAATGGSANAIVVSHTHTATSTDSGHTHPNGVSGANSLSGAGSNPTPSTSNYTNTGTGNASITTTVASAGTSGTNANLPPYYALAYVMKS
jgi:microcystin-dependent protein